MASDDDDLAAWLKKELGQAGYRKVKAMQGQGTSLEQALELYHAVERKKDEQRR